MGNNCCRPEEVEEKRGQIEISAVRKSKEGDRVSSLKPENAEAIREKYRRWIEDKQAIIGKNQAEIQTKKTRLQVLQASNKPLQVQKLRRQIDTHQKLIHQAQQQQQKIQQKLDKL